MKITYKGRTKILRKNWIPKYGFKEKVGKNKVTIPVAFRKSAPKKGVFKLTKGQQYFWSE